MYNKEELERIAEGVYDDLHADHDTAWEAFWELKGAEEMIVNWISNKPKAFAEFLKDNYRDIEYALIDKRVQDAPEPMERDDD